MKNLLGMLVTKGFYTYTRENSIIVAPPLIITGQELESAMAIMDEVLFEVDKMI
jgi:taurine--2-oxoglutarate transaminase